MAEYEQTRQRHLAAWGDALPSHLERLAWTREQIAAERDAALRGLVAHARAESPWHRDRLRGVDVDNLTGDDLRRLPTMTKTDLMEHFDDVVCDRRVTLDAAEAHLATLSGDDYFLGDLHVVASGGSSGVRGVFVYGWDAWRDVHLGLSRVVVGDRFRDPAMAAAPPVMGVVTAANATHMTTAAAQTFANPMVQTRVFPVTLPVSEIVAGLNELQPASLTTYASMLGVLSAEALAGRLSISPLRIVTTSEPLLPEVRAMAESAFGAPVANCWGTSEGGVVAVGCWRDGGMHLNEDLVIVEPVDEAGQPVPPGERSAKVLITNLFNPILPLIRYELTDEVTFLDEPCACGSAYRRVADILGRADDLFAYGSVIVHPHVIRSPLAARREVVEYQVAQTADGADVRVREGGHERVDEAALAAAIAHALEQAGVPRPAVTVRVVDRIERDPRTGKLKRFIPLAPAPAAAPTPFWARF